MKWMLLIVFIFVAGQAFSAPKFEKVHKLSYSQKEITQAIVIMKPLSQKKLAPLYKDFHFIPQMMIASRK